MPFKYIMMHSAVGIVCTYNTHTYTQYLMIWKKTQKRQNYNNLIQIVCVCGYT